MNYPMQPIIQHLFQTSTLESVTRQRLESFVEEYPSFGIGHYLLSRKLQSEDPDRYTEETRKTNLYFTNPFWLQWLLENSEDTMTRKEVVRHVVEPIAPDEAAPEVHMEEPVSLEVHITEEEAIPSAVEAIVPAEVAQDASPAAVAQEASPAADAENNQLTAAEQLLRSIEEAKGLRDSLQQLNEDLSAGSTAEAITPPAPAESPASPTEPASQQVQASPAAATDGNTVLAGGAVAHAMSMIEQTFIFEPYHTIDYFASQGVKLVLEENPSDQLGKQLKSFTDWLKTMRRMPQKEREIIPDRAAEQTVQTFAAHSVVGKEVLTETMAEVLAKQGMPERARAVYEKLSLLDPDKKAYFAKKIEQLNIR